jgi:hypothetical protein
MDKSVTETSKDEPLCDCTGSIGNVLIVVFLMVACVVFGYLGNELKHQHRYMKCPNYTTKYATWVGYVSYTHDEVRCFWVENEYPRRVRDSQRMWHGVAE